MPLAELIGFDTPRLHLRQWREADRTPFAAMNADPAVMEFGLAEIVSCTAVGNRRSRAVMERIGMRDAHEDFEHPGVPEGHALRLHCLYRIGRSQGLADPHRASEASLVTVAPG